MHTTMSDVDGINFVLDTFYEDHGSDDCGPCDAKTARKTRAKHERESAKG